MKRHLPLIDAPTTRRTFLETMAAALALAGLEGCARPRGDALPFDRDPVDMTPGRPLYYATALPFFGYGIGVIGKTREGRPIKLEGNPDHPESLGAATAFQQAAVWDLYDPRRANPVMREGQPVAFQAYLSFMREQTKELAKTQGAGLRFLFDPTSSPSLKGMRKRIAERFPQSRAYAFSPSAPDARYRGTELLFGQRYEVVYDLASADVIVALDADFLLTEPSSVRLMRQFADRRVPEGMPNRLYAIECALTTTGMNADHRFRARSSEIAPIAFALLSALIETTGAQGMSPALLEALRSAASSQAVDSIPIGAIANDLTRAKGRSLVIAGLRQPPIVHAAAALMNEVLGNTETTVRYLPPRLDGTAAQGDELAELVRDIERGEVELLVIDAFDPVYAAPVDLELPRHLEKVPHVVYTALYADETTRHCEWFVPKAHELESWGDYQSQDGTVAIVQPLIEPIFQGRTPHEVLAPLLDEGGWHARELVQAHWKSEWEERFDAEWPKALVKGAFFAEEPTERPTPSPERLEARLRELSPPSKPEDGFELNLYLDARLLDGRHAHNPVLQELADPVTKLAWGNAALVSPKTASRLGIKSGDMLFIGANGRNVEAPAYVLPGHADDAVSLSLGYGRLGAPYGVDAYRLRTSDALWFRGGVIVRKTGKKQLLVTPQEHDKMEGRPLALVSTLSQLEQEAPRLAAMREPPATLYRTWHYPGHKWGMMVDLSRCTGCSACVVACHVENNGPVVGPTDIARGRDMHWLRIDRYFEGSPDEPVTALQPVMCQHCEMAPCEYVCPVNATVHSDEGLNEMVYNRCVGTRYCSNNCPYKVRRFNWFDYQGTKTAVEKMRPNPEVTLRSRGVMEKCTYCVQRIERARIEARVQGRDIREGEVLTACQQTCPAAAIVFGDLNDPESRVRRLYDDPRRYDLLHELGTLPRTGYLVRVKNPNPEIA